MASRFLISLDDAELCREQDVGGKAAKLARLLGAGFRVPSGFCLTAAAYASFARMHGIEGAIRMELERKPLEGMRWEEMWDSALRIRSLFLARPLGEDLNGLIAGALGTLDPSRRLVVRSSALDEDSAGRSFAGLHESLTDVVGFDAVVDAVRLVWASLWSDAALLYRSELQLDPASSRMAVLVQEMVEEDRSGVAFGRDPRPGSDEQAVVEAVPGPCRLLVDGEIDPDHWEIDRRSRKVLAYRSGERTDDAQPLLQPTDLDAVVAALFDVESLFEWAPDIEWTGRSTSLTVLQARPITTAGSPADGREWYLTLRPGDTRLRALRKKVAEELIPRLEAEGARLAGDNLADRDDEELADALDERLASLEQWEQIYWDDFIPFAHGVRRLAIYYNDAVRPKDPYEFVGLLKDQDMLASRRNRNLESLAGSLSENDALRESVGRVLARSLETVDQSALHSELGEVDGGAEWVRAFERFLTEHLDVAYSGARLTDGTRALLHNILQLAASRRPAPSAPAPAVAADLERTLLETVGPDRESEAREVLETARLSWRLRDDDNLLVGRIESQLLRAIQEAETRLRGQGRVTGERKAGPAAAKQLAEALRDRTMSLVLRERAKPSDEGPTGLGTERPRQLIGQPASPGLSTGRVRCVRGTKNLGEFRAGEILVCDAIQPTITHLVPLASAIVERRGGMLIHGAIIARELGIPCVNGVRDAADLLRDGDVITVDGHLGVVTVGPPDFDLELAAAPSA